MNKEMISRVFGIKKNFTWCFKINISEKGKGYEVSCEHNFLGKMIVIPYAIISGIVYGINEAIQDIKADLQTPYKRTEYCDENYNKTLYENIKKDLDK